MSDEKINPKAYKHIAARVLNRAIQKREKQIAAAEAGNPTSQKNIAQLRYEMEQMLNELMERSIIKQSEENGTDKKEDV